MTISVYIYIVYWTIFVSCLIPSDYPLVFLRTKAEPPIFYMFAKAIVDDPAIIQQNKEKVHPSILPKNFITLCVLMYSEMEKQIFTNISQNNICL